MAQHQQQAASTNAEVALRDPDIPTLQYFPSNVFTIAIHPNYLDIGFAVIRTETFPACVCMYTCISKFACMQVIY